MRKLSVRQKTLLDRLIAKGNINSYYDIPADVQKQLEDINDYETMWTDINRYIWDRVRMKLNRTIW